MQQICYLAPDYSQDESSNNPAAATPTPATPITGLLWVLVFSSPYTL